MHSNSALHCVCTRPLYTLATLVCVAFQKATLRFSGAKRCATHGNPTREVLREMSRDEARHDLSEMFRKEEVRSESSSSGGGGGSGVSKGGDNLLHTAGGSGVGEHTQSGGDTIAEDDKVLVVLGGSLGAAAINTAMRGAISMLLPDDATYTPGGSGGSAHGARDWSGRPNGGGRMWVVWQAGASGFDALRAAVPPHPRLLLTPFIDRMEVAYGAADLAVARAGAITCSELLATRTPSVLVPSPNVAEVRYRQSNLGGGVVFPSYWPGTILLPFEYNSSSHSVCTCLVLYLVIVLISAHTLMVIQPKDPTPIWSGCKLTQHTTLCGGANPRRRITRRSTHWRWRARGRRSWSGRLTFPPLAPPLRAASMASAVLTSGLFWSIWWRRCSGTRGGWPPCLRPPRRMTPPRRRRT